MVPLLIIDRSGVSIMSTYSRTRRVTHLRFVDARVENEILMWWDQNFAQSLGWDPGHHEELWNGLEIKIRIWEVDFGVPEKFRNFPASYRSF